ncbi:hypothetical protein E2C01_093197 [Portunus trituberculatus]|uniref:Uncharacterized protein n=1 Tax=Portunus trituberculatus TaxID=210409 RepID=A0A5B7JSL6_PORTR|nr:hypothetical protein [Portunus trituberculatus]
MGAAASSSRDLSRLGEDVPGSPLIPGNASVIYVHWPSDLGKCGGWGRKEGRDRGGEEGVKASC